jgi:hypothetical protein
MMITARLQRTKVDKVDKAHFQLWRWRTAHQSPTTLIHQTVEALAKALLIFRNKFYLALTWEVLSFLDEIILSMLMSRPTGTHQLCAILLTLISLCYLHPLQATLNPHLCLLRLRPPPRQERNKRASPMSLCFPQRLIWIKSSLSPLLLKRPIVCISRILPSNPQSVLQHRVDSLKVGPTCTFLDKEQHNQQVVYNVQVFLIVVCLTRLPNIHYQDHTQALYALPTTTLLASFNLLRIIAVLLRPRVHCFHCFNSIK